MYSIGTMSFVGHSKLSEELRHERRRRKSAVVKNPLSLIVRHVTVARLGAKGRLCFCIPSVGCGRLFLRYGTLVKHKMQLFCSFIVVICCTHFRFSIPVGTVLFSSFLCWFYCFFFVMCDGVIVLSRL